MTDLLEEAASVADGMTALVGVTDEGHKGEREELRRIADGLGGMAELVPLLAAASSAATAPLVEKLQGFKGADGVDGKDGEPGRDGADGGPGPVGPTGANGSDGRDGLAGKDGLDGAAGRNGTDGSPGGKGDKGLNWRGAFDGRISYQPDDAIEFQGSSFVAVAPIRGLAPPNGWDLLARRGAQGPSGSGGGGGVALSNAIPLVESGSGAAGSGTKASKDDHVHPADGGGGGGADDQTAAEVPFTPAGGIAATDVQAAIEEVAAEAGGLPPQWTDGGNGDVTATTDDPTTQVPFTVDVSQETAFSSALDIITPPAADLATGGANAYVLRAIASDKVATNEYWFQFDAYGYWSIIGSELPTPGQGGFDVFTDIGDTVISVRTDGTLTLGAGAVRLTKDAAKWRYFGKVVHVGNNTLPDNADLAANDYVLWFDSTPGSAALKIKAKDDNGDVVTATIPLTP